jgi:hypothetical protein
MPSSKSYVTDIQHFLDNSGELAIQPVPARKLPCFLTLIIDSVSQSISEEMHDTRIRCRAKGCRGTIQAMLNTRTEPIIWRCPVCDQRGSISNWQRTKWDHSNSLQ